MTENDAGAPQDAPDQDPPVDPAAPRRFTLPSGKVVEAASARTLTGGDMAAARAAQPGGTYQANLVAIRETFICRMVTEIEAGRRGGKALDGTIEALHAQQPDDWMGLYLLAPITDAFQLVTGVSVIPDVDGALDPKAPTAAGPAASPG